MSYTLKELSNLQISFDLGHKGKKPFFQKITADNFEELEHLTVCLAGEVGEFANIVKKIRRGDFDFEEGKKNFEGELADVFIYLIKLASQLDIDLEEAFLKKREQNINRFKEYTK